MDYDTLASIQVNILPLIAGVVRYIFGLLILFSKGNPDYKTPANCYDGQTFDYIIVGGGTAGSIVANRLTEDCNCNVLLIEAGGFPTAVSNVPALFPFIDKTKFGWGYDSDDDKFSSQAHKKKTIHIGRGKMLGGSSCKSYMSHVRGCEEDYNNWVKAGNQGWDWTTVLEYFKKFERLEDVDILMNCSANLHSTKGPLKINRAVWSSRIENYFEAFEEMGFETILDVNGEKHIGYSVAQFTTDNMIRQSASVAYLRPIRGRKNFYLLINTLATKIIIDKDKRATAVEVKTSNNKIITLKAKKEIILSAGAINSPQLLMLSGIGPKEHLNEMKIKVILHSPNVGENLQDHVLVPVKLTLKKGLTSMMDNMDFMTNLNKFPNPVLVGRVALDRTQKCGDYITYSLPFPVGSFIDTLLCTIGFELNDDVCKASTKASLYGETFFAVVALLHPESRGNVKLNKNDPEVPPIIRTGYFSNKKDLERHALYVEDYLGIVNTSYFKSVKSEIVNYNIKQCKHINFGSHEYWKCHVLNVGSSMWDYAGTCAMGPEGEGVVDEELLVRGLKGLRIVDSSVMPKIVSGNINAAVMMIAEKASDMIKKYHGKCKN